MSENGFDLLDLPVEILIEIFGAANDGPLIHGTFDNEHQILWNVCLTNKFLLSLAQPILYRNIYLQPKLDIISAADPTFQLHRTLTNNPKLGFYVRQLHLDLKDDEFEQQEEWEDSTPLIKSSLLSSQSWTQLLELTNLMSLVQTLRVSEWVYNLADFIGWQYLSFAISKMPRLKKITVLLHQQPNMVTLLNLLGSASYLSSLEVTWRNYIISEPIAASIQLNGLQDLGMYGTAPEVSSVIQQCTRLRSIRWWSLEFIGSSTLLDIFLPTKQTLRALRLCAPVEHLDAGKSWPSPSLHQMRVNEFAFLTRLSITNWQMKQEDWGCPKHLYDALFSGALREFQWLFKKPSSLDLASLMAAIKCLDDSRAWIQKLGSSLKTLSIYIRLRHEHHPQLHSLQEKASLLSRNYSAIGVEASSLINVSAKPRTNRIMP
jgi:hypothetical protein